MSTGELDRDNEHQPSVVGKQYREGHLLPSTPRVRIELEDLIGNTEDIFNRPPPLGTPGDHVHWGDATGKAATSTQPTQNSRKRARSSSPASSQLERSVHFDALDNTSEGNRPPKALRTPNNDPTQELWRRYMNANGPKQAESEALPAFSRLPPSSPMTPSTGSKDSGLRRTVSCGIEWPTSKPKRRKVDVSNSNSRTKDLFAASRREIMARDVPKTSRVSLLVEKIQESLARQARADEPSSSSPLPEKHSQMQPSQASPTHSPSKQRGLHRETATETKATTLPVNNIELDNTILDEFDDDGMDLEFFEEVEKGMSQVSVTKKPPALINNHDGPQDSQASASSQQQKLQQQNRQLIDSRPLLEKPPRVGGTENFEDSFDAFDEDDDIFTTEMETLAAQVDSQRKDTSVQPSLGPAAVPEPLLTITELDGSFDGGDDDLLLQIANDVDHREATTKTSSQVRAP